MISVVDLAKGAVVSKSESSAQDLGLFYPATDTPDGKSGTPVGGTGVDKGGRDDAGTTDAACILSPDALVTPPDSVQVAKAKAYATAFHQSSK